MKKLELYVKKKEVYKLKLRWIGKKIEDNLWKIVDEYIDICLRFYWNNDICVEFKNEEYFKWNFIF